MNKHNNYLNYDLQAILMVLRCANVLMLPS